jgi:hypothetical protein
MTIALPPLPPRIASLPRDERGYPIPAFVQWVRDREGLVPDFRIARTEFRARAFRQGLCWICGDRLGVHKVYLIGPMCVVNRVTSEPASHRDCATFAATACPFLIRPRQKRNPKAMPEDKQISGMMIERNPGCVALYETRQAETFQAPGGWLIRLGKPDRIDWMAEGRQATRAEILASIDSGYPLLLEQAMKDSVEAVDELVGLRSAALKLVPAE